MAGRLRCVGDKPTKPLPQKRSPTHPTHRCDIAAQRNPWPNEPVGIVADGGAAAVRGRSPPNGRQSNPALPHTLRDRGGGDCWGWWAELPGAMDGGIGPGGGVGDVAVFDGVVVDVMDVVVEISFVTDFVLPKPALPIRKLTTTIARSAAG